MQRQTYGWIGQARHGAAGATGLIHDAMVEADAPPGMLALLSAASPG
jgi:hypothetical protein